MNYHFDIQRRLVRLEDLTLTEDRIAVLKEAIAIADHHRDMQWGWDLRQQLLEMELDVSSTNESLEAFTWLMQAVDEEPEMFKEEDILWKYKWILRDVYEYPTIPKAQIDAVQDDFKRRYKKNGYSLRPFYNRLLDEALAEGRTADAEQHHAAMMAAPHDDMSNCKACEQDSFVMLELAKGNVDEALRLMEPLMSGAISCHRVPFRTYASVARALEGDAHAGDISEMYRRADADLQGERNESSSIRAVCDLMIYLSKTDLDRAWAYVGQYSRWAEACNPNGQRHYFSAIYQLSLAEKRERIRLSAPLFFMPDAGPEYRVADIREAARAKAYELAQSFDDRNGYNCYVAALDAAGGQA